MQTIKVSLAFIGCAFTAGVSHLLCYMYTRSAFDRIQNLNRLFGLIGSTTTLSCNINPVQSKPLLSTITEELLLVV